MCDIKNYDDYVNSELVNMYMASFLVISMLVANIKNHFSKPN